MLWKSISPGKLLGPVLSTFFLCSQIFGANPLAPDKISDAGSRIKIIYPKPDQIVGAVDSAFILGNVPAENEKLAYKLFINDQFVPVHPDGGFIGFVPVTPGQFEFELEAFLVDKDVFQKLGPVGTKSDIPSLYIQRSLSASVNVLIPQPIPDITLDSIVFDREMDPPSGHLFLGAGDRLKVSFRGTPYRSAWFSIPGVIDSVPMAEITPQVQPYWGEAVFGAGAVPDSLKIRGIYSGFYDIGPSTRCDSVYIEYHLAPMTAREIVRKFWCPPHQTLDSNLPGIIWSTDTSIVDTQSSYAVTLNDPGFPATVCFMDSVQILRHRPLKGYFSIFQPRGVQALAVGAEGDWYKIQLSATQFAWALKQSVEKLPYGALPPHSYLKAVRFSDTADRLLFELPLAGKHPFRVFEDDRRTLRLQLFGVTSDTDWIRYDFSSDLVDLVTWSQPEPGMYELRIALNENIWGYDSYYEGNTFFLQINKPPDRLNDKLKGKRIVLDPGHSRDFGAIGPTGLTESIANLAIALELRKELQSKGAIVIMTREDTSHVELYDRPVIAGVADADLFVSIHNNALPDGVNPSDNNGSSTYYYHPHSIDMARAIHKELLKETKLRDFGLYHGNLAVNRPTQYPAVLVECAFMILPEQEALLKTTKFREKVAKGITKGLENFLKEFGDD